MNLVQKSAAATAVVFATSLATAPVADAAPTAASRYANTAHQATNKHRAAHDLTKLNVNACLKSFAIKQATRMAQQQRMFHQKLGPIIQKCNLRSVGENVAYGYPTGWSVVNQGWMRSPGHRANILHRSFRIEGIAARRDEDGRWFASQVLARKA